MMRWVAFVLMAVLMGVCPAVLSQALPVPVEYPGATYPLTDVGRVTHITPGQAANSPRFVGGAISEIGTLRVSTIRPAVGVPAQFEALPGTSRTVARGLRGMNPYLVAGLLAAWLAHEGIQKCQQTNGDYFWCINHEAAFKDLEFWQGSVGRPPTYATPDAAAASYWAKFGANGNRLVTQPCVQGSNRYNWVCRYAMYGTSGSLDGRLVSEGGLPVFARDKIGNNTTVVPATQDDFDRVADRHPLIAPDAQPGVQVDPNADALINASPVPIPVTRPGVQAGFIPASENPMPYPCAAFASGRCLDGWRMTPTPTADCPNCVQLTPVTVDAANPDAVRPPVAGTEPEPDTGAGAEQGTAPDKQRDPCELDPGRLGCIGLGRDDGQQVARRSADVSFVAEAVGLPVGCPADVPGPGGKPAISYAGYCDAAGYARPVVVALGAMAALMIVIAAVRS